MSQVKMTVDTAQDIEELLAVLDEHNWHMVGDHEIHPEGGYVEIDCTLRLYADNTPCENL